MILRTGNLWDAPAEVGATVIGVTTNSMVKRNGGLVMGRGAALEAKTRYPDLDLDAGEAVEQFRRFHGHPEYGWLLVRFTPLPQLGLFQVKHHWRDEAELDLIAKSCGDLRRWLQVHAAYDTVVALNFPGIGNGRLPRAAVLPILRRELPDQVYVYEREE